MFVNIFRKKCKAAKSIMTVFCIALATLTAHALKDKKTVTKGLKQMAKERTKLFVNDCQGAIAINDAITAVVVAAVTMGVGAMIIAQIFPSIVGSDTDSNATIASIKATTWDAFALLPVALIVLAAVVILGIVMYLRSNQQ